MLYLNGSQGTFAETPAIPIHTESLTIAVWLKKITDSANQPIYGDWSSPHFFRLAVENGFFMLQIRDTRGHDLLARSAGSS